jgi:hypothetical protein
LRRGASRLCRSGLGRRRGVLSGCNVFILGSIGEGGCCCVVNKRGLAVVGSGWLIGVSWEGDG